ncbi:MAG: carboxypeptidase-like regulatory domain-containing protein [Candidatus Aenigmatarchaeota archaeon]
MKKLFFLSAFVFFFILSKAYAFEVRLSPENVFCLADECEKIEILVNCSNASQVSGRIEQPIKMDFPFTKEDVFRAEIPSYVFENTLKPFLYTINLTCKNSSGEFSSLSNFYVSTLEASIESLSQGYLGDEVAKLVLSIKKDNLPLTEAQVSFSTKPLNLKGWYYSSPSYTLLIEVPKTLGTYNLEVLVNVSVQGYRNKQIKLEKTLEVKQPLELSFFLDKKEVRAGDSITLTISALERGEPVLLTKDYLSIKVGSEEIEKDKINLYSSGNAFKLEFQAPELSPGEYDLTVTMNYKNYSVAQKKTIAYVFQAFGKIVDINNQGIPTEIKFLKDGQEKRFVTDSSGSYSGFLVPGNYDLQVIFPQATLYLYNVAVSSFEDPIKYYFFDSDVEGIKVAGLFVFEFKLPYSSAKILMKYDERKVANEKDLVVYKCSDFNPSNKLCNSEWKKEVATIDTVSNLAIIETKSLSAYAVGTRKFLVIDFSFDKNSYSLKEVVKVRGLVKDETNSLVPNALIKASSDFGLNVSTYSDSSGIFYFEFFAPESEGIYKVLISAEKGSYISSNKSLAFQVFKKKEVSMVIPDTIRILKGENRTIIFSLINTGQAEILNLSLSLTGLPESYFKLQERIDKIGIGEKVDIPVIFIIPRDAKEETLSLTFKIFSEDFSKEEVFGLTIVSENATQSISMPSAAFSLPELPLTKSDLIYISIFAVFCFSFAFILKKTKKRVKERERIKNLLLNIKMEMKRKKESPMQAFNNLIERNEKEST